MDASKEENVTLTTEIKDKQPEKARAVALNIDRLSLISLRKAFPNWEISVVDQATTHSLDRDWDPADLLVLGIVGKARQALSLCRAVRSQMGRAYIPLLVLAPAADDMFVKAALEAGASACLRVPVDAKELVAALKRLQGRSRPGRHTLDLHLAQEGDIWRDDGGEG
jgi:DNA-binding response OmpR family regulator